MAKSSIKLPPVPPNLDELIAKLVREALAVADNAGTGKPLGSFAPPAPGSAISTALPPPAPGTGLREAATAAVQAPSRLKGRGMGPLDPPKAPKAPKAPKELGPTNPDSVRMQVGKEKWDATYTIFVDAGMTRSEAKSATNSAMTMAARADAEAVNAPIRAANKKAKTTVKQAEHASENTVKREERIAKAEAREAKRLEKQLALELKAEQAGTRAAPATAPRVRNKPKGYKS